MMTPQLAEFYKDLDSWLRRDNPPPFQFRPDQGLCDNLDEWAEDRGYDPVPLGYEIIEQFAASGLSTTYPFDRDNADYSLSCLRNSIFTNKARLLWIKARMQQIERDKL